MRSLETMSKEKVGEEKGEKEEFALMRRADRRNEVYSASVYIRLYPNFSRKFQFFKIPLFLIQNITKVNKLHSELMKRE